MHKTRCGSSAHIKERQYVLVESLLWTLLGPMLVGYHTYRQFEIEQRGLQHNTILKFHTLIYRTIKPTISIFFSFNILGMVDFTIALAPVLELGQGWHCIDRGLDKRVLGSHMSSLL